MSKKSFEEFEDVQKEDVKNSKGFFLFMLAWMLVATAWLLKGGAEDGAWWMLGIGGFLLLFNAVAKWLTRKE